LFTSQDCYLTNNKDEIIYKNTGTYSGVRYYDIDFENNLALTEWGWCTYSNINTNFNWMTNINSNLTINQINIPGTHDSGTYGIYDRIEERWARTQN